MRILPHTTLFSDVEIRGVRGQPVFNYYKLIGKTLEQFSDDPNLKYYLARPDANISSGEISWSTDADGQIKKFSSLNDADKEKILSTVSEIRSQIRRISEKLTTKDNALKEVFYTILLITNLERCLFVVGDIPVVCEWGCNANAEEIPSSSDQPEKTLPVVTAAVNKTEAKTAQPINRVEHETTIADTAPNETHASIKQDVIDEPSQEIPIPQSEENKDTQVHAKNNKIFQPEAEVIYQLQKRTPKKMLADFSKYLVLLILFLQILIIFFMGWMRDHASFFSTENLQAAIANEETQLRTEINNLRKQAYLLSSSCPVSIETEVTDVGGTQTLQQRVQLAGKDLSGSLVIALTWNGKHDLDLYVEEPGGITTGVGITEQQASQTGGMIDLDMNNIKKKASMNDNPVEIVKWQRPPPLGAYAIGLRLYRADYTYKPNENISYHLLVARDGKVILDKSSNIALALDCKNQNKKCATINAAEFEVSR